MPATCPRCGAANRPGAKFCDECAAPLTSPRQRPTPEAEAANRERPLGIMREHHTERVRVQPAVDAPPDGERKNVTALFADIKGSMELMEHLDPEEARAIIDPALQLMVAAVRRYDGYLVQSTGDGIFALFGAPVAHEDHPQRRIERALGVIFMRDRRSEQCENAVTGRLHDVTAVAMDRFHHELECGIDHGARLFGVEVFHQFHRALDIGEQRGHCLALSVD